MDTKLWSRRQVGGMHSLVNESVTTGSIFWCCSVTGSDTTGYGYNPDKPTATIDYAHDLCTASKGDIVFVMPGHVETWTAAAGVTQDLIGVSVIGLGNGDLRPTITLGTSTDCDWSVTAEGCRIKNIKFVSAIDSLKNVLDLDAGGFTVEDCMFVTDNSHEAVTFIDIATTKDNFYIRNCEFYQPTDPDATTNAAGTGGIYFADSENIFVEGCVFYGYFESAIFHNKGTAAKNLWVRNCVGYQALSDGEIYVQVANMIGGEECCLWTVAAAADVTETKLIGTASVLWFSHDCGYGNDSDAGSAGAAILAACS